MELHFIGISEGIPGEIRDLIPLRIFWVNSCEVFEKKTSRKIPGTISEKNLIYQTISGMFTERRFL